jgi:hypothetical protein
MTRTRYNDWWFNEYGVAVSGFSTGTDECCHKAWNRLDRVSPETELITTDAIVDTTWVLVTR